MTDLDLRRYTDEDLRAELRRREAVARAPSVPPFRCARCGAVRPFAGPYSAAAVARQRENFDTMHRRCLPTADGGLI